MWTSQIFLVYNQQHLPNFDGQIMWTSGHAIFSGPATLYMGRGKIHLKEGEYEGFLGHGGSPVVTMVVSIRVVMVIHDLDDLGYSHFRSGDVHDKERGMLSNKNRGHGPITHGNESAAMEGIN